MRGSAPNICNRNSAPGDPWVLLPQIPCLVWFARLPPYSSKTSRATGNMSYIWATSAQRDASSTSWIANGAKQMLGLGLLLRYLATSGAKSDVIFFLGDPYKGDEISRLSCSVFEIWRGTDRQTTDRQTRRPFYKALTLQYASLIKGDHP